VKPVKGINKLFYFLRSRDHCIPDLRAVHCSGSLSVTKENVRFVNIFCIKIFIHIITVQKFGNW
jgi:hypothetical protein